MANLFLGFPVTRAKIADMIAAGAAALDVYTNLFWQTYFESIDRFKETKSGTGTITKTQDGVYLNSGPTIYSTAYLQFNSGQSIVPMTFDKERRFKTNVWIYHTGTAIPQIDIWTGDHVTGHGFGFRLLAHNFMGISNDGTGPATKVLKVYPAGAINDSLNLEAILTPGTKVDFYIDGVLKDTVTTKIPSGASAATWFMSLGVFSGHADDDQLFLSNFKIYQKP